MALSGDADIVHLFNVDRLCEFRSTLDAVDDEQVLVVTPLHHRFADQRDFSALNVGRCDPPRDRRTRLRPPRSTFRRTALPDPPRTRRTRRHRSCLERPVQRMVKTFSGPRLAAAVVDRITYRAHIIQTGTDSYRLNNQQCPRQMVRTRPVALGQNQAVELKCCRWCQQAVRFPRKSADDSSFENQKSQGA